MGETTVFHNGLSKEPNSPSGARHDWATDGSYFVTIDGYTEPVHRTATAAPAASKPERVSDVLAWSVVALALVGLLAAITLPTGWMARSVPFLVAVQIGLLVLDRLRLRRVGVPDTPGWGWVLVAPAYLYRRGRALGVRPRYAHAFLAIGLATRVSVNVFGPGGGDVFDTTHLERELAAQSSQTWEQPAETRCPARIDAAIGTDFECTVHFSTGSVRRLAFTIEDASGRLRLGRTCYSDNPDGCPPFDR